MLITVNVESVLTFVALLSNVLFVLPFPNFPSYCTGFSASKTHDGFAVGLHHWASHQLYRFYSILPISKRHLKLEGRVQSLESCHATTRCDVDDIKKSLNSIEVDRQETSLSIKKMQNDTNMKLRNPEEENLKLGARIEEVEDQHPYLEAYSRRENLKLENIPEDDASREDTELVLRSFLERELGYKDAASVEIQRVHRLGKKKEGKPRPILARFLRFKDCQSMLALGPRLRETNYKMYQDLPFQIVERRRAQMDTFKKARRNNILASFSKAQPDKLFIRGKFWPVGKELDL